MGKRSATITRTTKETDITAIVSIDGAGNSKINTGIGFFDHMLDSFCRHGLFDMELKVTGDLHVDAHHTVEDTGIVLGHAFLEAIGDKAGIKRYGHCILPMDDALLLCALDISGRHYLSFDASFSSERVGNLDTELVREFFYAFADASKINLHIKKLDGQNNHHLIEGMFKAFAKALDQAVQTDDRIQGVLSTKGKL